MTPAEAEVVARNWTLVVALGSGAGGLIAVIKVYQSFIDKMKAIVALAFAEHEKVEEANQKGVADALDHLRSRVEHVEQQVDELNSFLRETKR